MKTKLLNILKNNKLLFLLLIMCIIFYFQINDKFNRKHQQLIEENINEIKSISTLYENKIASLEIKVKNYESKNITITKKIEKKNGDITTFSYVDLSTKEFLENKNVTNFEDSIGEMKQDVLEKRKEEFNEISNIQSTRYMAGVLNKQVLSSNFYDYSILVGVRLFSTPLFVTVSPPITKDFYAHTVLGALINF